MNSSTNPNPNPNPNTSHNHNPNPRASSTSPPVPIKRPLAPAPVRPGLQTGPTPFIKPTVAPLSVAPSTDYEGDGSIGSSDIDDEGDEDLLVTAPSVNSKIAPSSIPVSSEQRDITTTTGNSLYVELEGAGAVEGDSGGDADEFEELEELLVEDDLQADRDELVRTRIATSQAAMKNILDSLTEEQLQRYETFRRVGLPRPMIKKILVRILEDLWRQPKDRPTSAPTTTALSNSINANTIIIVSGIAKVFIGELIEEAKLVQERWKDDPQSPLSPFHILEAHRRLKSNEPFSSPRNILIPSRNYRRNNPFV